MNLTFEKIMLTRLRKFYKGRDTKMLSRKYAVFLSSCCGMQIDYIGRELDEVHDKIDMLNKNGQKSKMQGCKIGEVDFNIWRKCLQKALESMNFTADVTDQFLELFDS